MNSDVSLVRTNSIGVDTLLDGVSWERAFQELCRAKPPRDAVYMIFDKSTRVLALMVPSKSLRCSRIERVQRLHKARKLYELNVEHDVFCPSVEVSGGHQMRLRPLMTRLKEDCSLYEHLRMTLIALLVLCVFFSVQEVVS